MTIKDCFGNLASVGDEIAYSVGNSGAKTWEISKIIRITDKSVFFNGQPGDNWRQGEITELRRGNFCFVINMEKRLEEMSVTNEEAHEEYLHKLAKECEDESV